MGPSGTLFLGDDKITFQSDGNGTKVVVSDRVLSARAPGTPNLSYNLDQITAEKVEELVFAFVQRSVNAQLP